MLKILYQSISYHLIKIIFWKFITGVESPQAVQKMLSLVQNSRMKQQNVILGSALTQITASPVQSPIIPSKGARMRSAPVSLKRIPSLNLSRPVSNIVSDIQPVDLTAESSSVTNLYSSVISNSGKIFYLLIFHMKFHML